SSAGSVDIHATTTFSVGTVSLTRATGTGGLNSADANKIYVSGSITWTKVDGAGAPLAGAVFEYKLQSSATWIEVIDDVDGVTAATDVDKDPDPAQFQITG